jgi:DNA-binding NarL/FixJ family response regulator
MMRLYLQRCLTRAGYEVEEWVPESAMEVPDRLAESKPDLVLSDYQMPGCNGATVARMAGKTEPRIPVVILTAFKDDAMVESLGKFGVRHVITKPIDADALIDAVREALGA